MHAITAHEFDVLAPHPAGSEGHGVVGIPVPLYHWLEAEQFRPVAGFRNQPWIRPARRAGVRGLQLTGFVGVVRAPTGHQIEVLPKIARRSPDVLAMRSLLLSMLACMPAFRHLHLGAASVRATRMPLYDVFVGEFLEAVNGIVKQGLRGEYVEQRENVLALRGRLIVSEHMRRNVCRADRFFTEHDEFNSNRPENRLLRAALRTVIPSVASPDLQRAARVLDFAFGDVPVATDLRLDFSRLRVDRNLRHYQQALAWARLILAGESPLTLIGQEEAPALMVPMDALFEAFVAKHLAQQLAPGCQLEAQTRRHRLVRHRDEEWFALRPDLVVRRKGEAALVLDTKWKLVDENRGNATDKYDLSQIDFYQLEAYGRAHLGGAGDVVLVYPATETFARPLPAFHFLHSRDLRLWVLPFDLTSKQLRVPDDAPFKAVFNAPGKAVAATLNDSV